MTDVIPSYIHGAWHVPRDEGQELLDPSTGQTIARASVTSLDYPDILDYARTIGGPALRTLTFPQRASILKDLAKHLGAQIPAFADLSLHTGATRRDAAVDVDGGIGVLFSYAKWGTALPDAATLVDGETEQVGKGGTFAVRHLLRPREGVAVQINAYNFPVWGMLEKFAPAFLAGVPTVAKPASQTSFLTQAVMTEIVASGLLPEGALQLVCARPDGLVDALGEQDSLAVTGSADTAATLRVHPAVAERAVRFTAEADSLNVSILGPDARPGDPAFDLFVKSVATEMTQKTGQKCTAIRRALVPRAQVESVIDAVRERLAGVVVGNPADAQVRMGPLVSVSQRDDVRAAVARLATCADIVFGDPDKLPEAFASGSDFSAGAFMSPILLRASDSGADALHGVEAFGPVSTLIPYDDVDDAVAIAARGRGSLAGSVVTDDDAVAAKLVAGLAPWHGRLLVLNSHNAGESTGHGAAIPHAIHGGPGRAGGGEELGALRGMHHHLARTAVCGTPEFLGGLA